VKGFFYPTACAMYIFKTTIAHKKARSFIIA